MASGFLVDAMLGSLARKLRILGFDTVYVRDGTDRSLIELCASTDRVLLTADRALAEKAAWLGLPCFLLSGKSDGARLSLLASQLRSGRLKVAVSDSRCALCNGPLSRVSSSSVAGEVPRSSLTRHRLFYRCSACGHVYWRGRHWKKLRGIERRFREALSEVGK
jgi:uncharacterized protein with PIN domain